MQFNLVETISHISIAVASVALGGWLLCRIPPRLSVMLCLLAALVIVPLNLWHPTIPEGITAWAEPRIIFQTFKGVTVALSAAFILAWPGLQKSSFPRLSWLIIGILALNIIEALLAEGRKDLTINMVTGLLLISLMPTSNRVSLAREGNRQRVSLPVDWIWILIYVLWNFAFVLQITGQGRWIVFNFSQILALLLLIRLVPDRFILARGTTLFVATFIWQVHGIYDPLFAEPDIWSERELMIPIRNTAFAIMVVYLFMSLRRFHRSGDVRTLLDAGLRHLRDALDQSTRSNDKQGVDTDHDEADTGRDKRTVSGVKPAP